MALEEVQCTTSLELQALGGGNMSSGGFPARARVAADHNAQGGASKH